MARTQQNSYKGQGVVLHTVKYGDSSVIAHLLTREGGRQSFIVQGVSRKKGRGSKAALLQPLFGVEYVALRSSMSELHRFKELQSALTLRQTPFDVRRSTIALFIAELLYRVVRESECNEALFNFVWSSIESLDTIEEGLANLHLHMLVNLSSYLGFTPHGEWSEGMMIDTVEGCFCSSIPSHGRYVDCKQSELIAQLLHMPIEQLGEVKLSREQRVSLLDTLIKYYGYHLDTIYEVQSLNILKEIF